MLSKVPYNSYSFGTGEIIKYCKKNNIILIQDNLIDKLLIKNNNTTFIYDYKLNKYYNYDKFQIEFNHYRFIKQINSFDQNNIFIANKIRKYVLSLCYNVKALLGIGGEYYLYMPFIKANYYYGISNHESIIEDANNNIPYSNNYLVNYNDINSYPNINAELVIVNVYNLHNNIIKYIKNINFNKLIIISCHLPDNKLKELIKHFKIESIKYFTNYNTLIRIIVIKKYKNN